jgi:hypothetical protein
VRRNQKSPQKIRKIELDWRNDKTISTHNSTDATPHWQAAASGSLQMSAHNYRNFSFFPSTL